MKEKIIISYRSFILICLFILFGLGALFIRYIIFPVQKERNKHFETLQKAWEFFISLMVRTGLISIYIDDKERLKNIKNSIIVATHPSFIDIVILMSLIPHSTCFVAEKLARNPFLKGMANKLFILEGQDMDKWVNDSVTALNNGFNVIIFPMGTRHRKDETPRIRRGAGLIASVSGKDIVVLNLEQSYDFLHIHQPFYDAGDKTVVYKLKYLDTIYTREFLEEYPDSVTFKTEITKRISQILYN